MYYKDNKLSPKIENFADIFAVATAKIVFKSVL